MPCLQLPKMWELVDQLRCFFLVRSFLWSFFRSSFLLCKGSIFSLGWHWNIKEWAEWQTQMVGPGPRRRSFFPLEPKKVFIVCGSVCLCRVCVCVYVGNIGGRTLSQTSTWQPWSCVFWLIGAVRAKINKTFAPTIIVFLCFTGDRSWAPSRRPNWVGDM